MRICFITPEYALLPPFGGIATHIRTMAQWLAKHGHDMHVVCPDRKRKPGCEDDKGVQVHFVIPRRIKPRRILNYISRIPGLSGVREAYYGWDRIEDSLGVWQAVHTLERKVPFDVIQCGDFGGLAFCGVWPIKRCKQLLLRGHGLISLFPSLMEQPGGRFHHVLEKISAQKADYILTNSQYFADIYSNHYGVSSDRLGVMYRPYDLVISTKATSLKTNFPIILYVGRIEQAKGIGTLIEALQDVHKRLPVARVNFIGEVVPAMKQQFGAFLQKNRDWVTHHGPMEQSEVFNHMCRSDLLVLPSRNETAGGVLVEAQFCGLPQIASRVGGIPELVQDGITGLLVEPDNSKTLAEAILRLCTTPELRQRMADRSLEQAHTRFNIDLTMTRYVRLLEVLVAGCDPREVL